MKFLYFVILSLVLFLGIIPAKADYITTQSFVVDVNTTITVVTSGTLNTAINGSTGELGTPLSLNFNITTNQDANSIRMHAFILDSSSTKQNAFYCTSSSTDTSQPMYLALGDYATGHQPNSSSINDCLQATSTSSNNADTIAYPGTVSINNGGSVQYITNGNYFDYTVKSGTTDINLTLATTPKPGTYDSASALDEPDNFEAEIYLDNIPGT